MDYVFGDNDIFYVILKLGHKMKREVQNKLKQYDITLDQWVLLYFVYQNEGCNQKKLSETSSRDTGALTRSLNTLETRGLIERKSSYQDKREFLIYLTTEGRDLYKITSIVMDQNAHEVKDIFDKSELGNFMYLLDKLDSNLE